MALTAGSAPFTSDTGRLAAIPLWLLKSPVSGGAIRLYGIIDAEWTQGHAHSTIPATRGQLAEMMQLSKQTIDRFVTELEGVGALTVTRRQYGETWLPSIYTLHRRTTNPTLASQMGLPTLDNSSIGTGLQAQTPSPKSRSLEKKGTRSVQISTEDNLFVEFYQVYPLKKGKKQALKTWKKLGLDTDGTRRQEVMVGVHRYAQWVAQEQPNPRYLLHPSTWLTGQRWEDVLETAAAAAPLTAQTRSIMEATAGFLTHVTGRRTNAD